MPDQVAIQRGRDFEDYVARILGGRTQPGSGNKFYAKNDVVANGLSISCKSEVIVKYANIRKYLSESVEDSNGTGNIPALAYQSAETGDTIIVMRLTDFIKAFENEVKISQVADSKGIQKRKEIETPLMLR